MRGQTFRPSVALGAGPRALARKASSSEQGAVLRNPTGPVLSFAEQGLDTRPKVLLLLASRAHASTQAVGNPAFGRLSAERAALKQAVAT